MRLTLIGKAKMYEIVLPSNFTGTYWITDEEDKKLVRVDGDTKDWYISTRRNTNEKIKIKEYNWYQIGSERAREKFILYCSPVYEENFTHLKIIGSEEISNNVQFTIGSASNNGIIYNSEIVSDTHAKIFKDNGRYVIENFDNNFGTYVNNAPVYKNNRVLLNGDVVFIMGLKLIVIGDSIFVNDPLNKVKYDDEIFSKIDERKNEEEFEDDEEDEDIEIYEKKSYYSRAPRITNKIETEKVKIDAPPAREKMEQMPLLLMLGSTLSMGAIMIITTINSISGIRTNGFSGETFSQVIIAVLMLVSILLIPVLQRKYEKKQKIKNEKRRQKRYKEYIDSKIEEIDQIIERQRKILYENFLSVEECTYVILSQEQRLWERKIEDSDFLTLRLGNGDMKSNIDIQYPEKQFTMEDDNLVEMLNTVAEKSKLLKDVPVTLSLAENNVVGLISKSEEEQTRYMKSLILQLVTFHSYEDLKLVFLLKKDNSKRWEHLKLLPHVWNSTKDVRYFSDEYDEMQEISKLLEEELQERAHRGGDSDYKEIKPYYLIITDDYKKIENLKIITQILKIKQNMGFGMICMSDNLMGLPDQCRTFVELNNGTGSILESEMSLSGKKDFTYDTKLKIFWDRISTQLSNIPIKYNSSREAMLPSNYTFLEMYDVGAIEELNILERWKRNDSTISLKAPIGIDGYGMPITLDVHERAHGPHGLIAGSTGSGKSEFIITYILSLAINYHPDDVTFILIDYKGGALAGAFQKKDMKLPHLVGTITNIDTAGLQRSLASIQSELRRRQVIFNEVRNMTDEGTIDIYKYQKLYHEGRVDKPVPHLLIICDEFAELKQQQEEFMDELISVARIGRSLGIHLILATQKPAGIVNDQIRSNSKFGICLKVQDAQDSIDVIRRPEAAKLKTAGEFYMEVGNDEYFVLGQSAWTGAPYIPSDISKKKVDKSIDFISNTGNIIKKVNDEKQNNAKSQGEQLVNIVKYLHKIAKENKIETEQLWLEDIPENIYIKDIEKKYKYKKEEKDISPVIGEFDDPNNQRQGLVKLELSKNGNTIIYGNAQSGKETLLSTIVYSTITTYKPEEVWLYLLDFGSEALKIYNGAPQVGDVVLASDVEKMDRLMKMLWQEIDNRKKLISEYNGDYNFYIKTNSLPTIVVAINNYENFSENYEKYEDIFSIITREGVKYGVIFILTASNFSDIRYRLAQNFKQKIALQVNNEDDYYNIFDDVGKKRPAHIFGRGLARVDGELYEFQTAKICEADKWNSFIKQEISNLNENISDRAERIPVMPARVTVDDLSKAFKNMDTVPLGIEKEELGIQTYSFMNSFITLVSSKNVETSARFAGNIIQEINQKKNVDIHIIDAEKIIRTKKDDMTESYIKFVTEMEEIAKKGTKNLREKVCLIIGVERFIGELENGESDFLEILNKAREIDNYCFILVDNVSKLKNHEYDEWYRNYVSGDRGIWVGNGVDEQYLFSITSNRNLIVNNCGDDYGYVIMHGEPTLIKLLGMREKGDENG